MSATDMIDASFRYLLALAPFALVFSAIACADQLVDLVKRAASVRRSDNRGW